MSSKRQQTVTGRNNIQVIEDYFQENFIKQLHQEHRADLIQSLLNRSINKLVKDFLIEMDAKNKAYYFILETKQLEAFAAYCEAHRAEE